MPRPPKVVIPGLNRGAGIRGGYIVGRPRLAGKGPAQLLDLLEAPRIGLQTLAGSSQQNAKTESTAQSSTDSLSSSVSSSLSQISSSTSQNASAITSLSTAVSSVDSGQNVSLSQLSSSLSGANSSITSLSSAVSTVISGSISAVNSAISSLSAAGGGGGGGPDPGQSTSLSQISSSLSGAISSTSSLSTAISTVDSNQSTSISTNLSKIGSLSAAVSTVDANQSASISTNLSLATSLSATMVGDSGSGGTKGLVPAPGAGDAAAGKFLKADGTFAVPSGGGGSAGWTHVSQQTISSAVANVTFTGLGSYTALLIVTNDVTRSVSGTDRVEVSVDGGTTWFNTSGDYVVVSTAGVKSNTAGIPLFGTSATAARSGSAWIAGSNINGAIKPAQTAAAAQFLAEFVASTSPINAVRVAPAAGGNLTAGTVDLWAM